MERGRAKSRLREIRLKFMFSFVLGTVTGLDFLALIRLVSPTWDLLICCGRCTGCVQRHLAVKAVRCDGVDPGSLICMSKTMPDLGLALWAAWQGMWMQMQGKGAEQNEPPGTPSLYSLLLLHAVQHFCCAIISPLHSDNRIPVIRRMWTDALGRKKKKEGRRSLVKTTANL